MKHCRPCRLLLWYTKQANINFVTWNLSMMPEIPRKHHPVRFLGNFVFMSASSVARKTIFPGKYRAWRTKLRENQSCHGVGPPARPEFNDRRLSNTALGLFWITAFGGLQGPGVNQPFLARCLMLASRLRNKRSSSEWPWPTGVDLDAMKVMRKTKEASFVWCAVRFHLWNPTGKLFFGKLSVDLSLCNGLGKGDSFDFGNSANQSLR